MVLPPALGFIFEVEVAFFNLFLFPLLLPLQPLMLVSGLGGFVLSGLLVLVEVCCLV
jgi:hypothetical protein